MEGERIAKLEQKIESLILSNKEMGKERDKFMDERFRNLEKLIENLGEKIADEINSVSLGHKKLEENLMKVDYETKQDIKNLYTKVEQLEQADLVQKTKAYSIKASRTELIAYISAAISFVYIATQIYFTFFNKK